MNILEKDLEDLIWNAIENKDFISLYHKGLNIDERHNYFRQYKLGDYGICDIISIGVYSYLNNEGNYEHSVNIEIIELKKDKLNIKSFEQICRYRRGVQLAFDNYVDDYCNPERVFKLNVRMILIGTSIDRTGSFCFLSSIIDELEVLTIDLDFNKGISFKNHLGYSVVNGDLPKCPIIKTIRY